MSKKLYLKHSRPFPKNDKASLAKVNLDALIPREDLAVHEQVDYNPARTTQSIKISDLKEGEFFFSGIRKPDFQRETNAWDGEKIAALVESFIDGELIPAIILWWHSGPYTFVLDGAHRLSALIAWANDDYGDGPISSKFYNEISDEQREIAKRTRNAINNRIGAYREYSHIATRIDQATSEKQKTRALNLGRMALQIQWVPGDATKAESSYKKINQSAAPIDPTEEYLIEMRRKANAIAARAIIRSGKGHKYWSKFTPPIQQEIEDLSEKINEVFFEPAYKNPIKTLNLPIGGKSMSSRSLSMVLDFVNIVNGIKVGDQLPDDDTGESTISYLKKCKRIIERINSNHPSSLGLHPVIYLYAKSGKHKTASLFAVTSLVLEFEKKRELVDDFISVRNSFENILKNYDYLTQQIWRKNRGSSRAYEYIAKFYLDIIAKLKESKSVEMVVDEIVREEHLAKMTPEMQGDEGEEFSSETKSSTFIKEALEHALQCQICGGLIHANSTSIDHIQRKSEGGTNSPSNAQLAHPYCNTGYKH